jgi:hypothetical protein
MNRIRRNKLIYFGHIMRANSLEKDMIVAMGDGQRKRGRPRARWLDGIEEDTGMSAGTFCRNQRSSQVEK